MAACWIIYEPERFLLIAACKEDPHMRQSMPLIAGFLGIASWLGCSHTAEVTKTPPPLPAPTPQANAVQPTPPPPKPVPAARPALAGGAVYFDFDSSLLRTEASPVLEQVAWELKSNRSARVRIEGNCDERGTDEYNLALGAHRAEAAKTYLVNMGIAGDRIQTVSYGEERPRYLGHDEASWSKNRRDDVALRR